MKSFSSSDFYKISPSEVKRGSAMVLLNIVILAIGTIENSFSGIESSWDDKRMVIMRAVLEALAAGKKLFLSPSFSLSRALPA